MAKSVTEWCRDRGVTAEQLAERCKLDLDRVTAIVHGRWTPSPEERGAIASALGTDVEEVAWGHVTPVQHLYGHGPG
jgi:transcriptional regulator with XRE-family HTH domain